VAATAAAVADAPAAVVVVAAGPLVANLAGSFALILTPRVGNSIYGLHVGR
jgi:hypothetical protein